MSDTAQLTEADLDGMSPGAIAKATRDGQLNDLLAGVGVEPEPETEVEAEAEAETPPPASVDQGARGTGVRPYTEEWLRTASADEIARATAQGKLGHLL